MDIKSKLGYLNQDGTLKIQEWATDDGVVNDTQTLSVSTLERPVRMKKSPATGEGLITNGKLGIDVIRLGEGDGFKPHTHPGDHLLISIAGKGTITYDGKIYPTRPGQVYMIEGEVPHAVGAITDHVILAIGSPHKLIDSNERMSVVEYESVTTEIKEITCLICNITAVYPETLLDKGCTHCPSSY